MISHVMHFCNFELHEEPSSDISPTLELLSNCLLPPGVRFNHLGGTNRKIQMDLELALVRDNHLAKWFFNGSRVKFMCDMTRLMGAWKMRSRIGALC